MPNFNPRRVDLLSCDVAHDYSSGRCFCLEFIRHQGILSPNIESKSMCSNNTGNDIASVNTYSHLHEVAMGTSNIPDLAKHSHRHTNRLRSVIAHGHISIANSVELKELNGAIISMKMGSSIMLTFGL